MLSHDLPHQTIDTDCCVVGGGMAGLCAAIAAARGGSRVVLVHDRPMLGGNASSEVRMWISGAKGADNKETGILEEIQLANLRHNPFGCYSLWDHVLYDAARREPTLTLLLGCSVCGLDGDADRLRGVRAWHLTRQCWIDIRARQFIDCSGDAVLRFAGAPWRWGREARAEFGESRAPEVADRRTMGSSILIQLRESDPDRHQPYVPPSWATVFREEDLPHRPLKPEGTNWWWIEIGGEQDTIADADAIRDQLLADAHGIWALIKNHPDGRGHRWELEWIGSLPGKRENVRYEGDHVLTQNDIEAGGPFDDIVAYGGWSMDDHHPSGIRHPGEPTVFHPAPSPYGIPYRCLYSRRTANLWFAGRCLSVTHMALSSTRVMATCALLGQAVGTAAAVAQRHGCDARTVGQRHLRELQHRLMEDDVFLPHRRRQVPALARSAELSASTGDPEPLRDGVDRRLGDDAHAWVGPAGSTITYRWAVPTAVGRLRLVADSELHRMKKMPCRYYRDRPPQPMPGPMLRDARIELLDENGNWRVIATIRDNPRRLIIVPIAEAATGLRVTIERCWDEQQDCRLFAFDVGTLDPSAPVADGPPPTTVQSGGHRMRA